METTADTAPDIMAAAAAIFDDTVDYDTAIEALGDVADAFADRLIAEGDVAEYRAARADREVTDYVEAVAAEFIECSLRAARA